jgi:tyrosyl-tRNA synthetase
LWLDPKKTSPYRFYQFWLNVSDIDASTFIRIFSVKDQAEIINLEEEHKKAPHTRLLQKALAKEVTIRVHSEKDYAAAVEASEILFGKGTEESLKNLSEDDLLSVFEGVPQVELAKNTLDNGLNIIEFLSEKTNIFPSKGEARKMLQGGGVFINKTKIEDENISISGKHLLNQRYILAQKGKKNYFLVKVI